MKRTFRGLGAILALTVWAPVRAQTALPPDPYRCTFAANKPGALADGKEGITFTILLRDETGQPVAGVAPSRVVVSGPPGPTLTQPLSPSGTDGRVQAFVTSVVQGDFVFAATLDGTPLPGVVRLVFIAAPFALPFNVPAGKSLLSVPLFRIYNSSLELGAAFALTKFWSYDALEKVYVPRSLQPGDLPPPQEGFWAVGPLPANLTLLGLPFFLPPASARQTTLPWVPTWSLQGEWNLLGNPLVTDIRWQLNALQVLVDGQMVGYLSDPRTWQWVDPYVWTWDGTGYRFVSDPSLPGFEGVDTLVPRNSGFWARRAPSGSAVGVAPDFARLGALQLPTVRAATGWALSLEGQSAGLANARVTLGANTALGRDLAIQGPPDARPGGVTLGVVQDARLLYGAIRCRAENVASFDLLAGGPAGAAVTLSWPRLGRELPAGRAATLVDLVSGRRVALAQSAGYTFRADGTLRALRLEIGPPAGRPSVTLAAAPTRARGAALTVVLGAPARVTLQVRSQSGRLVRALAVGDLPAGANAVAWDGRDDQGRPVPAGTYRLAASADDGQAIARATLTVTLR